MDQLSEYFDALMMGQIDGGGYATLVNEELYHEAVRNILRISDIDVILHTSNTLIYRGA